VLGLQALSELQKVVDFTVIYQHIVIDDQRLIGMCRQVHDAKPPMTKTDYFVGIDPPMVRSSMPNILAHAGDQGRLILPNITKVIDPG
jgi:hypothetical protein